MVNFLIIVPVLGVLALLFAVLTSSNIGKKDAGNERMQEIAGAIAEGARAFLFSEYKVLLIFVAVMFVVIGLGLQNWLTAICFIVGSAFSVLAGYLGMGAATKANVRTAAAAQKGGMNAALAVAFDGGSVMGLAVAGLGLFGVSIIYVLTGNADILFGFSLGASSIALFARVGGGIYTKAADISADILGKIRNDLPEDDSRVPNVIADFIGDNVNDIAGNCSDLLESFVATISASIVLAVAFLGNLGIANITRELFTATYMYPLVVAGGGLLSCVVGIFIVSIRKMGDNPSKELNLATYISAGLTLVVVGVLSYVAFGNAGDALKEVLKFKAGWATPWICCALGLASGVAIGMITEYYTSADFKPTRTVAEYAVEGEAFVVTKGDAVGSKSVMLPVAIIGIALVIAGSIGGTYGIAIAALGMLSFVGTTVSIDAFGPIADNAGGLAESCHLDPEVRKITDKLDSVGNTTAAVGKGFAIGSAAFATVSLICAYVSNLSVTPGIDSIYVIAGCIIGGALIEFFIALLTDNTIASAKELADVGDRQLSDPAILAGEKDPDYNELVALATKTALKRMLLPSVIALAIPFVCGAFFGPEFVIGILLGATIVAIPRAIFMGNSGGAFDNAKKYIESGAIEGHGKGSAAHKAAVTGDTIGDTRKDVVGVALDIFIKMMSTVATTLFVVITALYSLIQSLF